jgi:hypothetical protein
MILRMTMTCCCSGVSPLSASASASAQRFLLIAARVSPRFQKKKLIRSLRFSFLLFRLFDIYPFLWSLLHPSLSLSSLPKGNAMGVFFFGFSEHNLS